MMVEKAKYGLQWAILGLLLAGGPGFATSLSNSDALLWKVTTDSGAVSHVFGTIHSDDPRVQLKPAARAAFESSERLALEIVLTPEGMLDMMARLYRRDGSELKQDLPAPLYARTVEVFRERGLDEAWVNRLTIWGAAMNFMIPESHGGVVLDLQLQAEMQGRNKPVYGLETVESQLAVFSGLDKESQIKMLGIALDELGRLDETTEHLIRYYLREDIAAIAGMEREFHTGENRAFMERLMDRLIDQRNRRMAAAMREHLDAGRAFVAIGALHLPGEQGIISLLQKAGYEVERVR